MQLSEGQGRRVRELRDREQISIREARRIVELEEKHRLIKEIRELIAGGSTSSTEHALLMLTELVEDML